MATQQAKVDYAICAGVDGHVASHRYRDGRQHHPGSHSLCPACKELTLRLFRQELARELARETRGHVTGVAVPAT